MAELKPNATTMQRDFSRVVLTLENVLVADEKLSETPSMLDGLDKDIEVDLRVLGCEMIQTAGILLKLPQVAMATAQVVFQRFYYSKSFIKHNMEVVAMACLVLASKIEENPRRNRDVINVFHHIKQVRNKRNIHPLVLDQHYINLKNQVIKAERRVLKELGFCVHVKHPHKIIVMYLQVLDCKENRPLVQLAWNYMNDSLRSDVFMRFHPESIACACIYLASRQLKVPLPNQPPWFLLFAVDEEEIKSICHAILCLYARPKPNLENLEKTVEELKKKQQAAKSKARGILSDVDTPNSSSRQNSPKIVSPNPPSSLLASMKKEKERAENEAKLKGGDEVTSVKSNGSSDKKRSQSVASDKSFSKSGSSGSRSSRSKSPSPVSRKRRLSPHVRKSKKHESLTRTDKHKKKYYRGASRSRSRSRSPGRSKSKKYRKEESRDHRDSYKDHNRSEKTKDRDYYREKDHYKESRDYRDKEHYRDSRRSFTPDKEKHRSRKHKSNGHRESPTSDKLDKHRR